MTGGAQRPSGRREVILFGVGHSGTPGAIFAARRGAHVLLVEAADRVGGTLQCSSGSKSAGGIRFQESRGIEPSSQSL